MYYTPFLSIAVILSILFSKVTVEILDVMYKLFSRKLLYLFTLQYKIREIYKAYQYIVDYILLKFPNRNNIESRAKTEILDQNLAEKVKVKSSFKQRSINKSEMKNCVT